jgi:hypothetical protein
VALEGGFRSVSCLIPIPRESLTLKNSSKKRRFMVIVAKRNARRAGWQPTRGDDCQAGRRLRKVVVHEDALPSGLEDQGDHVPSRRVALAIGNILLVHLEMANLSFRHGECNGC